MANVGGRQLTLGACGLTKFAETADGRKVQLHIPKYVQGPVGESLVFMGSQEGGMAYFWAIPPARGWGKAPESITK